MEVQIPLPSYTPDEPAIHRLVDDILEYIFLLNAISPDRPAIPPLEPIPPNLEHVTTVASSQVCTRWRSIALNCHTIWGLIIDYPRHSLKWIETLLNRSNPSLLDFGSRKCSVCLLKDDNQSVLGLVFNHIDRLRIFNLYCLSYTWDLVCSRFLQLPAPNIEFVHLMFTGDTGHLTHPLFNNNAPNLQTLSLLRCSVDLTSPVLTSLTELYAREIFFDEEDTVPTVLDWLNILGGMPSLRRVDLNHAISSAPAANDICPVIHLIALDMLSIVGPFDECVTLVKHLILPPRCGLKLKLRRYYRDVGFDQRQLELCAIIEKRIDSWAKNAPNRCLKAVVTIDSIDIENLSCKKNELVGKEVDPDLSIFLKLLNLQETVTLFNSLFALFQRTFFTTTCLHLGIEHPAEAQVLLPLVDSFRDFVNLEKLFVRHDSLSRLLFPLLQQANSVLFPKIKSIFFSGVNFEDGSDTVLRVADFLRWRREQGFPVQEIKINSLGSRIDRKYVLTHIQDTAVDIYELYARDSN